MRRISSWVDERSAPVAATVLIVFGGLIYTILWSALALHNWQSVSDLWNSAEISLATSHGHWAAVYGPTSQVDSPPGFEFLLAPFMALAHGIGMHTAAEIHHGYAPLWLILVPVTTVLASSVLFALDAIARSWDYPDSKRLGLALVASLGVVSATVFWGHPEDCIALALVLWAALAVEREGTSGLPRAAWLLGVAAACQPLALLAAAPVASRFGWRALPGFVCRLIVPSVLVLLPELLTHSSEALHHIVDQPFLPAAESSTPLSHLARPLGEGMYSGGTLRSVVTVAAVVLGWMVCRRRHDMPTVLFVMAVAFTLRVMFESELLGFYFFPVVAICLLLTLRRSWKCFELCAAASVVCTALGNRRQHAIALWWPAIMLTTLAMVLLAAAALADLDTTEGVRTAASDAWRRGTVPEDARPRGGRLSASATGPGHRGVLPLRPSFDVTEPAESEKACGGRPTRARST